MKLLTVENINSPVGEVSIFHDGEYVVLVDFSENLNRIKRMLLNNYGSETNTVFWKIDPSPVALALEGYFKGDVKEFGMLKACLRLVGTEFQKMVWQQLIKIPFGQTKSYKDIAQDIGKPKAVRAVGAANGKNPISIIFPCHRVIGTDGSLTGYAGGLDRKKWLLSHEAA